MVKLSKGGCCSGEGTGGGGGEQMDSPVDSVDEWL